LNGDKIEDDIDEWLKTASKYDLSNFKEGYNFFVEMLRKEMPDFPIDNVRKTYSALFDDLNIVIFKNIDRLSSEDRNNRYIYFYNETMQNGIQIMGLYGKIKELKNGKSNLTNFLKNNFGGNNTDILIKYWREWEIQYNAFVEPVFKKLKLKLSRLGKSKRERQIIALKEYMVKYRKYKTFLNTLECLNTDLRNAIAHLDYYVDDEDNIVYYFSFNDQNEPIRNQISIQNIIEKIIILYYVRLFMIIYLSEK